MKGLTMRLESLQSQQNISVLQTNATVGNVSDTQVSGSSDTIDKVEIGRGNVSSANTVSTIMNSMEQISKIQVTQKHISTQVNALNKINDTLQRGGSNETANNLLKDVATNFKLIYSNLNDLVRDQSSEKSHTYFDGIVGSIPMKNDDLLKATEESKKNYKEINEALIAKMEDISSYSKQIINKAKEMSGSKLNIDFKQESANFTKESFSQAKNSFIESQSINIDAKRLLF